MTFIMSYMVTDNLLYWDSHIGKRKAAFVRNLRGYTVRQGDNIEENKTGDDVVKPHVGVCGRCYLCILLCCQWQVVLSIDVSHSTKGLWHTCVNNSMKQGCQILLMISSTKAVMILPSCPCSTLVLRQDHDRLG